MELFDKLNIFHESESGAQTIVSARDHLFSRPGARMFETICERAVYRISSFSYILSKLNSLVKWSCPNFHLMEPVWIRFQRIYLHIFPGYIMHYVMNPAKKCVVILATVKLDIYILLSKWDIRTNKNLCKAGLFVCVAAGKNDRIAV